MFDAEKNEKLSKLNSAIDQIRNRYGDESVKRARFVDSGHKHMRDGLSREKSRLHEPES